MWRPTRSSCGPPWSCACPSQSHRRSTCASPPAAWSPRSVGEGCASSGLPSLWSSHHMSCSPTWTSLPPKRQSDTELNSIPQVFQFCFRHFYFLILKYQKELVYILVHHSSTHGFVRSIIFQAWTTALKIFHFSFTLEFFLTFGYWANSRYTSAPLKDYYKARQVSVD